MPFLSVLLPRGTGCQLHTVLAQNLKQFKIASRNIDLSYAILDKL